MLKKFIAFGLAGLLAFAAYDANSQEKKDKAPKAAESSSDQTPQVTDDRPMSFWMEKKLEYSKAMLESLTTGEFEDLADQASRMRALGRIEGFVRRKNPDYRNQLRIFDSATLELSRHAKRGNAEGAALAFNQLTTSCVACHVMLREGIE